MMSRGRSRLQVVEALVNATSPLRNIAAELAEFPWDFDGTPVLLTRAHMANVLNRYLSDDMSAETVADWAELLELREDIDYEADFYELILEMIYALAEPPLDRDKALSLLAKLGMP